MMRFVSQLSELSFSKLMELYDTDLQEAALRNYPKLSSSIGLLEAQQDLYGYLKDVFFSTSGTVFALIEDHDKYICALRLEPYADGLLLCALITAEQYRRQGYAKGLVQATLQTLPAGTKVYSHVKKDNLASAKLHTACGFQMIPGPVTMLNGELLHNYLGFFLVV